jgi:RND family efflux transporter MFP subunit
VKLLFIPFVALGPLLALGLSAFGQGPPPSNVRVDPVQVVTLRERRLVTGNLRAARRARVAGEEEGRVLSIEVDEGARVQKGDLLARLDAIRLELDLDVLVAQEAAASALVVERERSKERAQRDLTTVESLVERNAANAKELADAQTVLAEADARFVAAQSQKAVLAARVALLRERIADTEVRAPFDGVVAALFVELGEWVSVGDEILDLVSDELEVWLDVPQRHLAALRGASGPLAIRVGETAETLTTKSWRLVPIVDPVARQMTVIAELSAETGLAPGMSATAWMPVGGEAQRPTVASDALLRNELGPYLFVAVPGAEGAPWTARPVQVEILWREGTRAVVAGPLRAGDATIVEGKERLYPGASVQPVEPPDPARQAETGRNPGREPGPTDGR